MIVLVIVYSLYYYIYVSLFMNSTENVETGVPLVIKKVRELLKTNADNESIFLVFLVGREIKINIIISNKIHR
jgi:hypothetical protein